MLRRTLPACLPAIYAPSAPLPPGPPSPAARSFVENLIDWNRVEERYIAATSK